MSTASAHHDSLIRRIRPQFISAGGAAVPMLIVLSCALIASTAPLGVSIVSVFLFAGPHNWLEARYLMTRMPARWGMLAPYFALGIGGTLLLGGLFAVTPWIAGTNAQIGLVLVAAWNTLLTVWIVSLALMRSRQNPRRDWQFLVPIGLGLISVNWLWPLAWSLALVYLHPLLALLFLDRELKRRRSGWLYAYRAGLLLVPGCLIAMAWRWAGSPDLPEQDVVAWQITHHAGASVVSGISTHFLVAAHVFLEMLHYLVWIVAIPTLSGRHSLWQIDDVPLARRSPAWRRSIGTIVLIGVGIILILWGSFLSDYAVTRNVYFTVAILHVLGEVPFLLRLL